MLFRPLVTDEFDVEDPTRSLMRAAAGPASETRAPDRVP